jgi:drug/metabolite transporter (DMT)-like permease
MQLEASDKFSELGVPIRTQGLSGLVLVTLSAICFGTNPIFARLSYEAGTDPTAYLFLRFLIASPAMFVIMLLRGYKFPRGRLFASLVLLSAIGAGTTFCFYTAIYYAPVNLIIVVTYMYPTFVVLLSAAFLKQAITLLKISALFLSIVGIFMGVGLEYGGYGLGILLGIGAAFCHSLFLILGGRFMQKAGSFQSTTIIIIISAFIYGLYVGFQGLRLPVAFYGWAAVAASGLFSTALGMVLFFAGLRRINTSNAAIISTFEVVVTASLAVAILGEALSTQKFVGACLVISAVVFLAKSEYATNQTIIDRNSLR